jgi:hypothetical protein
VSSAQILWVLLAEPVAQEDTGTHILHGSVVDVTRIPLRRNRRKVSLDITKSVPDWDPYAPADRD